MHLKSSNFTIRKSLIILIESANESLVAGKELADLVVEGMLEKKAHDLIVMDLTNVQNAVADFFVLCSGNSDTQIDAIAESIEEQVFKKTKQDPWKKEGYQNKEWILIDYVDVVAHVFNKEKRTFYALEELWGDARISKITE